MTPAQLATFKAAVQSDPLVIAMGSNATNIAAYYNAAGTDFVYRPNVSTMEIVRAISMAEFVALSLQVQGGFQMLLTGNTIDATSQGVRDGFATVFGSSNVSLSAIATLIRRTATRFEQLFSVGNVSPLFAYTVTPGDVGVALGA